MTAPIAIGSVAAVALAFWLLGVVPAASRVLATTSSAAAAMRDPELDDRRREAAVQQASLKLAAGFLSILIRGAVALLAGLLPVFAADRAGLASKEQVFSFLGRWDVMAVTTVSMIAGYVVWVRLWRSN